MYLVNSDVRFEKKVICIMKKISNAVINAFLVLRLLIMFEGLTWWYSSCPNIKRSYRNIYILLFIPHATSCGGYKVFDPLVQFLLSAQLFFTARQNFVCLFVCSLSSHWRIFHSFRDVSITGEGLQFDLCSALMSIEQWGFFNVPHPLRYRLTVYNGLLRGPV